MRAHDHGAIALEKRRRSRRLRARYRERASQLRSRAMDMISSDTRQVMLSIADYFQRMADRLESSAAHAKSLSGPKPTKVE